MQQNPLAQRGVPCVTEGKELGGLCNVRSCCSSVLEGLRDPGAWVPGKAVG